MEERKERRREGRKEGDMPVYRITEQKHTLPRSLQVIREDEVAKYRAWNFCPLAMKPWLVPALWPASPNPSFLTGCLPLAASP